MIMYIFYLIKTISLRFLKRGIMAKILVVDDEKSIRTTFKAFLSKEGHDVCCAENVDEALKCVRSTPIDLILTDIIMPKLSGIDLIQTLHQGKNDTPIIIMTGEPSVETAKEAIQGRAFDYLIKPVDKEELLRTVGYVLKHQELVSENAILLRTVQGTITTISQILEAKDPYTAGHLIRVGNLALALAKRLNLTLSQQRSIYYAGYLHDIGKLLVPAEILSKPGKLTKGEYALIQEHVTASYNLVKNIDFPWNVADIIHQHHERMDGSGYPLGLKGNEILFESRILAVADVMEAMTAHRPYRPSRGIEAAIDEVVKFKGTLYDKHVVGAAVALFEEDNFDLDSDNVKLFD
jgi:putative two-component system response regulator